MHVQNNKHKGSDELCARGSNKSDTAYICICRVLHKQNKYYTAIAYMLYVYIYQYHNTDTLTEQMKAMTSQSKQIFNWKLFPINTYAIKYFHIVYQQSDAVKAFIEIQRICLLR